MTPSVSSRRVFSRKPAPHLLALGILCALAPPPPALAQSTRITDSEASDLDAVTVTGIRGSLQSSMNLKRDSVGVIDGIIAEDIGKFPDTNLAESLQRISGVSIDRSASGEGSRVTVRGVGPDFNLVLLNGRQMPNTSFNSRAFDFANLASEAVSELQVYKTVHADVPTGGIGATINIKTERPLDHPGLVASVGVKGVMDTTADNLPRTFKGKSITPEVSGIFSNTWMDGRFGASVNFSYQERESGYSNAGTGNWPTFIGGQGGGFGELPLPGDPEYDDYEIINPPGPGDIYARPQAYALSVNSVHRQRRNGQIALQFAPTENLTATLDYMHAENRIQAKRTGLSAWFDFRPGFSSYTDGPIAGPIIYSEYIPGNNRDVAMGAVRTDEITEMKSLGFNVEWQVSDNLDLAFDVHDSRADIRPDNPFGTNRSIGNVAWYRGQSTVDYSGKFPILNMLLAPGVTELAPEHMSATGSIFSKNLSHAEIRQYQASGTFRFADYQSLDFGAAYTDSYNRTANSLKQLNDWGGMTWGDDNRTSTPDDYDDSIWYGDHIGRYFRQFPGYNDPRFTDRILVVGDFDALHRRVIEIKGDASWFVAPDAFTTDRRIYEKSSSAWLQWRNTFDWAVPVNVSVGMRYEKTEITSPALVLPPAGNAVWLVRNDTFFDFATEPVASTSSGEYDYWLPSLDIRADLRENLILRGSYGKSIGRAAWESLYGGLDVTNRVRVNGGAGSRGNPGLLPLESKNFDLSLEWYYGQGSYVSVGYFRKNIRNFISNDTEFEQPYDVHTIVEGEFWNEALDSGCGISDLTCIRDYIFLNHADDPSVNHIGVDNQNQQIGTITARDSDPLLVFEITLPVNQRADKLDGFEINLQHMFGNSGFGAAANYTKVDSGLTYDGTRLGTQSPMIGLSDTANLVVFYEKHGWQVRAAYNWRDKFLSNLNSGSSTVIITNPEYTESYGQLDMNVTWEKNEHLSFFVEGINLTDETMRIHGRHPNMLVNAIQTGPRYMFGARYKF